MGLTFHLRAPHGIQRWWTGLLVTTCSVSPLAIVTTNPNRRACCWRPGRRLAGVSLEDPEQSSPRAVPSAQGEVPSLSQTKSCLSVFPVAIACRAEAGRAPPFHQPPGSGWGKNPRKHREWRSDRDGTCRWAWI